MFVFVFVSQIVCAARKQYFTELFSSFRILNHSFMELPNDSELKSLKLRSFENYRVNYT